MDHSTVISERLIAQLGVAVFCLDDSLHLSYVNPAFMKMMGRQSGEVHGSSIFEFVQREDHPLLKERIVHAQTGFSEPFELQIVKEQKAFWVLCTLSQYCDGGRTRLTGSLVDISLQKRVETELMAGNRMDAMRRLAGGVAHEFNNLLMVMTGFCDLALEKIDPDTPLHSDIQEIQRAGQRASVLARQLLAFSRKQTLRPRILNLNQTIEELIEMLRGAIGADIQLKQNLEPSLGAVYFDPSQIQLVLLALTLHARDGMPEGGQIEIATSNITIEFSLSQLAPGNYVLLQVTDSSQIPDQLQYQHVFEPFFKGKDSELELGLPAVYGIVRQSGGHIFLDNMNEKGRRFRIYLPQASQETVSRPVRSRKRPHREETILVVEDEPAVRRVTTKILEDYGFRVLEAQNAQEAFLICENQAAGINLILTDVVMPGINGIDLTEHLLHSYPHLKVIFMSGYLNLIHSYGLNPSEDEFLEKPFRPAHLVDSIEKKLAERIAH